MTYYIINGSPRNNFNTYQLLEKAIEGIKSIKEDADVEIVDLYNLNYTGCRSCFMCKLKDGPFYAKCPVNDDLKDLLPKIWDSEGVIFGSPIYFGNLSGQLNSFLERLLFPKFMYGDEKIIEKEIPRALIASMNLNADNGGALYDTTVFEPFVGFVEKSLSKPEILKVYDTYQFADYDLYVNDWFDKDHKQEVKDNQFPKDLEAAYELGQRLAQK